MQKILHEKNPEDWILLLNADIILPKQGVHEDCPKSE
jgi:hypothetical protein